MTRYSTFAAWILAAVVAVSTNAFAQETPDSPPPPGGRVVFAPEGEVPADVRQQFEQNFEWGETRSDEEQAAAEAEAAEQARLQAERERMEAERQQAEADAERQRREAEAERQRQQAEDRARMEAEERARAEAEAEAQRQRAAQERERAQSQRQQSAAPDTAIKPSPTGAITEIEIDPDASADGQSGVRFQIAAEARDIRGIRLETAVYIYDSAGNPVMDTDNQYRSSRGQVYTGEYRVAREDLLRWTETLFIPTDQLELGAGRSHSLQAQFVVWEYSSGRGQLLTRSRMEPFTVLTGPAPMDLAGQWSDGVTIFVDSSDVITVEGIDVRGSIESQRWGFEGNVLRGVLDIRRRIGADRIGTYELRLSDDRRTLTGAYSIQTRDGSDTKDEGFLTLTR